uniref:Uncharacterized protein n=1 Tax=Macrostomum lignano TaxID=282301 RepID=A0A1I8FQL0_9PLAT
MTPPVRESWSGADSARNRETEPIDDGAGVARRVGFSAGIKDFTVAQILAGSGGGSVGGTGGSGGGCRISQAFRSALKGSDRERWLGSGCHSNSSVIEASHAQRQSAPTQTGAVQSAGVPCSASWTAISISTCRAASPAVRIPADLCL